MSRNGVAETECPLDATLPLLSKSVSGLLAGSTQMLLDLITSAQLSFLLHPLLAVFVVLCPAFQVLHKHREFIFSEFKDQVKLKGEGGNLYTYKITVMENNHKNLKILKPQS